MWQKGIFTKTDRKMIKSLKSIVAAFFDMFTAFMMSVPSHHIRLAYLRLILGGLGKQSTICRNVEIRIPRNIYIGNNTIINKKTLLDGRGGKIVIGDNVDIAQEVNIWTSQHDYNDDYHKLDNAGVNIEDYSWVAARATIIPGVTIGKGAVVGTCSLVTKDVAPMDVVGGVPAKHISTRTSQLKYKIFHRALFQ